MQYLVEGARGPLPPSPEQAITLLEGTVIPHFEYVIRLKTEGKILAGGVPVGDRAFVFIIEATSNDEADRIVRDMPAWGLLEWKDISDHICYLFWREDQVWHLWVRSREANPQSRRRHPLGMTANRSPRRGRSS